MAESESRDLSSYFKLTPRQRRLRLWTLVVLASILLMIVFGLNHPFFHPTRPPVMSPMVHKAMQVRILIIGMYWIVCTLLATSLILLAWLDVREIARKVAVARRDYARTLADRARNASESRDTNERSGES